MAWVMPKDLNLSTLRHAADSLRRDIPEVRQAIILRASVASPVTLFDSHGATTPDAILSFLDKLLNAYPDDHFAAVRSIADASAHIDLARSRLEIEASRLLPPLAPAARHRAATPATETPPPAAANPEPDTGLRPTPATKKEIANCLGVSKHVVHHWTRRKKDPLNPIGKRKASITYDLDEARRIHGGRLPKRTPK
jgi:hypothetical protein